MPGKNNNEVTFSLRLSADTNQKLKIYAAMLGLDRSKYVRWLIEKELDQVDFSNLDLTVSEKVS